MSWLVYKTKVVATYTFIYAQKAMGSITRLTIKNNKRKQ